MVANDKIIKNFEDFGQIPMMKFNENIWDFGGTLIDDQIRNSFIPASHVLFRATYELKTMLIDFSEGFILDFT